MSVSIALCSMDVGNDLDVGKILIWNTRLPFVNKPRISPVFSLVDLEWCLRYVHNDGQYYNAISLHQMIEGKMLEEEKELEKPFFLKTYMMDLEKDNTEIDANYITIKKTDQMIWFSGGTREKIFERLPWLYDHPGIKFACKFFDHPPASFLLQTETDYASPVVNEKLPLRTEDKSVQVSPVVPRDIGAQVSSAVLRDIGVQVSPEAPCNIESLSSDLSLALQKEILSDVTLECGGLAIRAHKCVLGFRSEVFRAMFQNEMLESETGTVKIPDMDFGVLEKLVKFIYSGKLDDVCKDCIADLYEAADKYRVLSLKMVCGNWIARNLNVESCVKYLKLADSHFDWDLRATLISFIIEHPGVLKSAEWLALSKEIPALGVEVLQTYFASTVH